MRRYWTDKSALRERIFLTGLKAALHTVFMELDHYSHLSGVREILETREKIVLKRLHSGRLAGKILDLGCGDGCFLSHAVRNFPELRPYGLDLSKGQLSKARLRMPQGQFAEGSLSNALPFGNDEFDVIYSGEVIEHLFDPDFFLQEAYRVLKPGGILYMTTPNLLAWYNRVLMLIGISPLYVEYSTRDANVGYGILRKVKKSNQPVGHLRIFHALAFKDLQAMHGFSQIKLKATTVEIFPHWIRAFDRLVAGLWTRGGSVLISEARKP